MRLGQRIVIATGTLMVLMGLLTVGLLQAIIANALGSELNEKGTATARVLADDLANPLLDGDALVVQRALNRFRQEGASVVYAYAYIPDRRQVIHTCPGGYPHEVDVLGHAQAPHDVAAVTRQAVPGGQPEHHRVASSQQGDDPKQHQQVANS
ncbi:MAG: hypothetical protein M1602_06435 [Firmicutes bacterium]|nr:hypothetical protein [Bacillota bacterium]